MIVEGVADTDAVGTGDIGANILAQGKVEGGKGA